MLRRWILVLFIGLLPVCVASDETPAISVDSDLVVFVSDSHIIGTQPRLERAMRTVAFGDEKRLETVCRRIVEMNPRPACVIHMGDLVSRPAHCVAYDEVKRIFKVLDDAKIPWYFVPGNHDNITRFETIFPEKKQSPPIVQNEYVSIIPLPNADLICLYGSIDEKKIPHLGPEQQKWFLNQLDQHRKMKRPYFVCSHHPVAFIVDMDITQSVGKDPYCLGFIHGHHHISQYRRNVNGLPDISLPSTGYTSLGTPLGFILLRLDKSCISFTFKTLDLLHPVQNRQMSYPR